MKSNDISINETKYIIESLKQGTRLDGRKLDEIRKPEVVLGDNGYVELGWGQTKVVIKTSSEIVKPFEDRPNEGLLVINNELSPMASIKFDERSVDEVMINRIIEKSIRKSNALDLEGLCIKTGEKVWLIRVDLSIINFDGNLIDSCCFGSIISLIHFKLPNYSLDTNGNIKVYNLDEKPPISLSVLHIPITLSISFFNPLNDEENLKSNNNYEISVFDATMKEELVRDSYLVVSVNSNKELIQLTKLGGIPIDSVELVNLCQRCYAYAEELTELIKTTVKRKEEEEFKRLNLRLLKSVDTR
ncbi:3'-5'-exoribonuclease [Yamadazyma tenuis]|uniref:Ribosomal protein S5 domain 2-like protein n=1 Tax=Candida tenuis (strain ATCC 10573 / BCRC 21748 / CBS 615 / JCM 9827 / NBRC 10315 / NRRL Y-1498 / VKM Y-70) TaxID=590646 RepID=G3AWH9_CANTC|nr:ribosomal protein S5 domain 2-like protein [Yamadazyma tenuis ATCC 10573]EGV66545.1 ribosomal protein S5 domain 2-like protein [Yamadazyma tenuis ATCC 10573]WEJ95334.1 3'-5'-exoribonuclease [Yamadazyma tenuis]